MITTSYFKNPNLPKNTISICLYPPSWYEGDQFIALSPSRRLLQAYKLNKITEEQYTVIFFEQLSRLNPQVVHKQLLTYGEDVCLLCYEKPGDFCHRHLVAQWLNKELSLDICEFGIPKLKSLW